MSKTQFITPTFIVNSKGDYTQIQNLDKALGVHHPYFIKHSLFKVDKGAKM